ncbi:MAG: DNA polymerase III subunit beta, partial [Anaerolineaceae bacterium]|nr:DNA polymerase III subunit beta [Anaerolineaceae bacterium]
MKITVNKTPFFEAIASLAKVATGKSAIQSFNFIKIKADSSKQTMSMTAADFEQIMSFDLPTQVEGNLEVAVSGLQLKNLVKSAKKDGEMTLAVTDGFLEIIDDERSQGQLPLADDEISFPSPEAPKDAETIILPANFSAFVNDASMCVSKDPTRVQVHGVCFSKDGITATDGRELFHVPLPLEGLNFDLSVIYTPALASIKRPWRSISTWVKEDRRFVIIRGDGFSYFAKVSNGKYPNWRNVIPDEKDLDVSIQFADLQSLQLKEFLQSIDKRIGEYVELAFEQNQITVTDAANRKLVLHVETKGMQSPGSVSMKAEFLGRMLKLGHNTLLLAPSEQKPMKATGGKGFYIFMGAIPDTPKHQSATAPVQEPKPVETENQAQTVIAEKSVENPPQTKEIASPETTKIKHPVQSHTTP